jgi:hypothetical protein
MMGPQTDAFDEEVQPLHDIRHKAEHDAPIRRRSLPISPACGLSRRSSS